MKNGKQTNEFNQKKDSYSSKLMNIPNSLPNINKQSGNDNNLDSAYFKEELKINSIKDIHENIKVCVRVKPLINVKQSDNVKCIKVINDKSIQCIRE